MIFQNFFGIIINLVRIDGIAVIFFAITESQKSFSFFS